MGRTPIHEDPEYPLTSPVGAVAPSLLPDRPPTPTLLRVRASAWTLLPLRLPALIVLSLLLLNGASASLHTWEPWVRSLRGDHRVLSLDLPPLGLTGPHPQGR